MKRVLSVLLAALMIMSVFSIVGYAVSYQPIDYISIQGVVAPKAGEKPSYTANNNNATNFRIFDEYEPVGENIYDGVQWFDMTTNTNLGKNDTFEAGHQYTVTVYLSIIGQPCEGCYMFPSYNVADVKEYINNKEANGDFIDTSLWEGGYSPTYWVSYTFPILENEIESIAVTGVTAPAKGAKPAYKATVASADPYTVFTSYPETDVQNGVAWYDITASKSVKSTDTFVEGHAYSVTVYLRAKEDYAFPRVFTGNATINGKSAVANPADALAMSDYVQDFMVIYEFPALQSTVSFPDVKSTDWYYDAVQYCAQKGFITGYKNGKFGPGDPLQRQDFVVIIARVAQANLASATSCSLKDVAMDSYYGPSVAWCVNNDIIHGYDNGKFGVGDKITREQVATILWRYNGMPNPGDPDSILASFPDAGKVSDFAKEAMAWAVKNEVITGKNGKLDPTATASRAEIATIIMRLDKKGMLNYFV